MLGLPVAGFWFFVRFACFFTWGQFVGFVVSLFVFCNVLPHACFKFGVSTGASDCLERLVSKLTLPVMRQAGHKTSHSLA